MLFREPLSALRRRILERPVPAALKYPTAEVFEWRPKSGAINFGDHLSSVVVNKILSDRHMSVYEETPQSRRLFAIGSVLHFAADRDAVWGSGINGKIAADRAYPATLDIRAVRGPLTAAFLRNHGNDVPNIFGDPALLLPTLFPGRFVASKKVPVVFVPNLHDLTHDGIELPIVSPLRGWNKVVEKIVEAELVLASSLHGLIIAEAYGIPARYVRLSDNEAMFKYDDYAQGTGRPGIQAARSIAEGLDMGGLDPISFDPARLLAAFPFDLWR